MSLVTDKLANMTLAIDRCISDNKGDQLAIRYRDKRYSYNDLAALMNRAGNMLKRFNIGVGDQILIAVSMSPSLVASVLGAMKVGATSLVVPGSISQQTMAKVSANGKAKLLIVDTGRLSAFGDIGVKHLVVGEVGEGQQSFLQEMRASASSLSRAPETAGTPALGIVDVDEIVWFSHGNAPLEKSEIGRTLVHLSRGEEVVIS